MGMEAPAEYGGSDFSFMTTILAIEELAKVDAAVAALVDIHNTLVVRFFKIMGNEAQKEKYLNILSTQGVSKHFNVCTQQSFILNNILSQDLRVERVLHASTLSSSLFLAYCKLAKLQELNPFSLNSIPSLLPGPRGIMLLILEANRGD